MMINANGKNDLYEDFPTIDILTGIPQIVTRRIKVNSVKAMNGETLLTFKETFPIEYEFDIKAVKIQDRYAHAYLSDLYNNYASSLEGDGKWIKQFATAVKPLPIYEPSNLTGDFQ